jgi:hypothetical protein
MADKSTQLILDALSRAVHDPDGVPLHGNKNTEGLFAATAAAKQAAQRCKDEGFLRVAGSDGNGRAAQELCAITEKGLAYLLSEANPKHVLEDFVRVLEARQTQVETLAQNTQRMQAGLESLKTAAQGILKQLHANQPQTLPCDKTSANGNGTAPWQSAAVDKLAHWHANTTAEDCPLPELYRHARLHHTSLTIGEFHDGLRQLHAQERIYLHPWTGPLYAMPDPPLALLIGHEIAYYASLR